MDNEIGTYSMILSKTQLGKSGSECPTKTTILAIHELIAVDNASTYGSSECVRIRDVRRKTVEWNYYLSVSPTSMSFGATGGTKSFTISSYKKRVVDGVEESSTTSVGTSNSITGSQFSLSGNSVRAAVNQYSSSQSGKVTVTQSESGKTATISLSQDGDSISSYGEWVVTVSANPTSLPNSGGTSTITATATRDVYWESGDVTTETANPSLSTNLGTISGTTLTIGENTSTSSRTATITASHGGASDTCTVTQAAGEDPVSYNFSVQDYDKTVGAGGGTTSSISITSTKTENGSTFDIGYSMDSTLPGWLSWNPTAMTFTATANTSTSSRSFQIYFRQNESGNRDWARVTQDGNSAPTPDTYVFTWSDNTTDNKTDNIANTTGTKSYDVKSTKNGSSQGWTAVSDATSWLTVTKTATAITYSVTANTGTAARTGNITLTQDGSGKTLKIVVSQRGTQVVEEWRYRFANGGVIGTDITNWSLANLNDGVGGDSQSIWSYKSKYVNGVEDASTRTYVQYTVSISDNWLTQQTRYDSGVLGDTRFTFTENSAQADRTTTATFTQSDSGKTCVMNILQVGWGSYVGTYLLDASSKNVEIGKEGIAMGLDITSKFEVTVPERNYSSYYYVIGRVTTGYSVKLIHGSITSDWARIQIPETPSSVGLWKSRFIVDANTTASSRDTVLGYAQSEIISINGVRKYGSKSNEMQMGYLAIKQQAGDYVPETNIWITVNNPQNLNVYPFDTELDVEALLPNEFMPAVDWGSDGTIRHFYRVSEGIDVCTDVRGGQGKSTVGNGVEFYTTEPFSEGIGSQYIRLTRIGSMTLTGQDQTVTVG